MLFSLLSTINKTPHHHRHQALQSEIILLRKHSHLLFPKKNHTEQTQSMVLKFSSACSLNAGGHREP